MQNRTPVAADARAPVPDFTPVPRQYRHDGWTPERQRAFIAALADTGSVSRAAAMVNMAQASCYTLRRAAGAESFRAAWSAALDFGVQRLKDIAFERAIDGQLVPVFVAGKLMGFRRKRNDALLMFCLRHYGQDAAGKRTTIEYFSRRDEASAATADGASGQAAVAQASSTMVCTTVSTGALPATPAEGSPEDAAGTLADFAGVALDAEAQAAIAAALSACAARTRAAGAAIAAGGTGAVAALADDPGEAFVPLAARDDPFIGELEPPVAFEELPDTTEPHWTLAGAALPDWAPAEAVAALAEPVADGIAAIATRPPRRKRGRRAD